ncbi:pseudaminic acid biosynthesis N-acetyl transferase [Shewanella putrefaciens]|nr:pseudaminic acid biosynthesis N-acetyl transferase [Shewanella putrefaciens]
MSEWPPKYKAYGVTLTPLSSEMLEMVRQWRNDPTIADLMLDKTHITEEMQCAWFAKLQGDQTRAYWVAYFKDEAIGVASLVNISQHSAEPGMYIYPERYRNNIVPFCVAFALNDLAFDVLGMKTLFGKIYSENQISMRFHLKCGYHIYNAAVENIRNQEQTDSFTGSHAKIRWSRPVPTEQSNLVYVRLSHDAYTHARDPLARFIRY